MSIFNLSNNGDLEISGNLYENENAIFSLSPSGDLNVNGFNQAFPNDNPNTIMSIGADGTQIAGQLLQAAPKHNIIDINNIGVIDSAARILENTEEHVIVSTDWQGTGLTIPINLKPNTNYRFTMDIEIIESVEGFVQFAIYNVTRNSFLLNNIVRTTNQIGAIQKYNEIFNSGINVVQSDMLQAGFVSDGPGSGVITFKIYKNSLRLELEGQEEPGLDNLILHYDFKNKNNNDANRGTAFDLSGNSNNGNLINFKYAGNSGYTVDGLSFDGINNHILTPKSTIPLLQSTTIYKFIIRKYGDYNVDYYPAIVSNLEVNNDTTDSYGHTLMYFNNLFLIDASNKGSIWQTEAANISISPGDFLLNVSNEIAVSYGSSMFHVYLNKKLVGSAEYDNYSNGFMNFVIGRWVYNNYDDYYIDGVVESVKIYDRVLSFEEINNIN